MSIPTIALESGADIAMIDTYKKDKMGLFDFLTEDQLIQFRNKAKDFGLQVALAGNLRNKDLPSIVKISPDIVGIRSLVCEGYDRKKGTIKASLIKKVKEEFYKK